MRYFHVTPFFSVLSRYSILLGTFTLLQYSYKYGINHQLNHANGEALTLQFLDSLTDGFVVLGGYA